MKTSILFIITVFCLLAAPVLASETSQYDKVTQNGTEVMAQIPSTLDEWERDPDWVAARELEEIGIDRIMGKRNRLEIDFSYDYLSNDYGTWKNFRLMYLRRELTFVYFFELQNFFREEGNGVQLVGGLYKDWNAWLYTYTALAAGTNAVYLPRVRFDQDFNFKFGKSRNYVFTVGGTYVDYHVNPSYLILSAGLSGYFDKWILGYRLFRNISIPGSVGSFSNSFELTYGREGSHWSSLTFSFGNQAYLSTELVNPVRINQDSQLLLCSTGNGSERTGVFTQSRTFYI